MRDEPGVHRVGDNACAVEAVRQLLGEQHACKTSAAATWRNVADIAFVLPACRNWSTSSPTPTRTAKQLADDWAPMMSAICSRKHSGSLKRLSRALCCWRMSAVSRRAGSLVIERTSSCVCTPSGTRPSGRSLMLVSTAFHSFGPASCFSA